MRGAGRRRGLPLRFVARVEGRRRALEKAHLGAQVLDELVVRLGVCLAAIGPITEPKAVREWYLEAEVIALYW